MRWAEKEKKKKIQSRIPFTLDPGKKIPKKKIKKLKNLFPALFLAKTGFDRPRKIKKILVSNSVHTRPGQENCKKYHKIEKHTSDIISSQNGMRQVEKEKKQFLSRIPFLLDLGKKIPKKIAKKFKKLKTPFPALFLTKTG